MIRVFSHWIRWKTVSRLILGVLLLAVCAIVAAQWPQKMHQIGVIDTPTVVLFVLATIVVNVWIGSYQRTPKQAISQAHSGAVVTLYLSLPFPVIYGVYAMPALTPISQEIYLLTGMTALFGTFAHLAHRVLGRTERLMAARVLIFGTGPEAQFVAQVLQQSDPEIHIVGFYPSPTDGELCIPADTLLARSESLSDTARAHNVQQIIIAVQERRGGILPLRELLDCKLSGITVLDLSSYFERALGQIRLNSLHIGWLIFGDGFRQSWGRTVVKRLFDIVCAFILIVLAMPVMLITALLIALEDGLPLFYRQERVGRNGRLFNVIKFRSMRTDAESDGQPRWASANDDRTTRVGRVIRKLRIDELPQLYSVLIGDMSLVGPRPERPYFVDQLTRSVPFYAVRHSVQPGVTGWAQVNYQYGASVEDSIQKLQFDLYYVKNHSLFLDLVIMLETIGVVLTGKGAQ